jgi:hypothetical protein
VNHFTQFESDYVREHRRADDAEQRIEELLTALGNLVTEVEKAIPEEERPSNLKGRLAYARALLRRERGGHRW